MTRTDKTGSQHWTAVSFFLGTHQHCVAKIVNASPRANALNLESDPFTISSFVLWNHLHHETRVATARVSGRKETKCHDWCQSKSKKKCGWLRLSYAVPCSFSSVYLNLINKIQFLLSLISLTTPPFFSVRSLDEMSSYSRPQFKKVGVWK